MFCSALSFRLASCFPFFFYFFFLFSVLLSFSTLPAYFVSPSESSLPLHTLWLPVISIRLSSASSCSPALSQTLTCVQRCQVAWLSVKLVLLAAGFLL